MCVCGLSLAMHSQTAMHSLSQKNKTKPQTLTPPTSDLCVSVSKKKKGALGSYKPLVKNKKIISKFRKQTFSRSVSILRLSSATLRIFVARSRLVSNVVRHASHCRRIFHILFISIIYIYIYIYIIYIYILSLCI